MPNNVEKLDQSWSQLNNKASWLFTHIANTILDTKIPVMNGKKDQKTTLRTELAWLPDNFKALHTLALRFRPGKSGEYHDGDLYGMLRRTEFNTAGTNATVQALVGAIAAINKGEAFDQVKLLASIQNMLDEQSKKVVDVSVTINRPEALPVRDLVQGDQEGAE